MPGMNGNTIKCNVFFSFQNKIWVHFSRIDAIGLTKQTPLFQWLLTLNRSWADKKVWILKNSMFRLIIAKRLKMIVCMTHFDWKFGDDWLTNRSCFAICSHRKLFGPRMMLNLWQTWAIAGHQSCPHRENICNKIKC